MRRTIIFILILSLVLTFSMGSFSYAGSNSGKIDFYKVFSKNDENIDKIGNRIYNWSIYLPSDAVINKDPKATSFDMYTNSFKTNVTINVVRNARNLTLEEIFARMMESTGYGLSQYDNSYMCSAGIHQSMDKNKYIMVSSIEPESYLYKTTNEDEENGTYREQRIYLGKSNNVDYIYTVTISMDFQYYRHHTSMFSKIADSFKTTFDANNPNIKDLSDLVTTYRFFENRIYGWKIELAPYWKLEGSETAIAQTFSPLYSDEEIGSSFEGEDTEMPEDSTDPDKDNTPESESTQTDESEQDNSNQANTSNADAASQTSAKSNKITDSLNVSVLSSISPYHTFDEWVGSITRTIQSNYNPKLYTILVEPQKVDIPGGRGRLMVFRIKNANSGSMIQGLLLAQGNGYRYKVELNMAESKYNEKEGKATFDRMLKSFRLTQTKSKYVKEFLPLELVYDVSAPKTIYMEKYDLKIVADNSWSDYFDLFSDYSYYNSYDSYYDPETTSSESFSLNHYSSGAVLSVSADLSSEPIEQTLGSLLEGELSSQDILSGILDIRGFKAQSGETTVYKITRNYNLEKIEGLSDSKKVYDYSDLEDTYTYIIKSGEEIYYINLSIPLINTSPENIKMLNSIWQNTYLNKVKIGVKASNWEAVNLDKFVKKSDQ